MFTGKLPSAGVTIESPARRILSLDVFRGITIAGMILVTDPGTYSATYHQLRHADWEGATATDMIFPAFLFIVGLAITFSFATRIEKGNDRKRLLLHVLRRAVLLIVLGLLLNGFPDFHWHTLRLTGILQRIALCYLLASLLYLFVSESRRVPVAVLIAGVTASLLVFYWILLKWCPVSGVGAGHLDTVNNLPAYIDRAVFTTNHMWAWGVTPGVGVTYDPEGLLSTLPALANTLIGVLTGIWLRTERPGRQKMLGMLLAGFLLAAVGLLLSHFLPLNKRIWTSTFALLSSGVSLLVFCGLFGVADLRKSRWWTPPALVLGTNAILAFALSTIITVLLDRIHVGKGAAPMRLHAWIYLHVFATWLAPIHASLAYAIAIVLFNIAIILPLYQRRIFLRI